MKLSNIDKKILELLNGYEEGLPCYEIARILKRFPNQIFKRLKRMYVYNILEQIRGKPIFWKINFNIVNDLVFYYVKCPKCNEVYKIHYKQTTILCKNCLTKSGKKYRFYVFNKRIIDSKRII